MNQKKIDKSAKLGHDRLDRIHRNLKKKHRKDVEIPDVRVYKYLGPKSDFLS
jgi:hypothetical protein